MAYIQENKVIPSARIGVLIIGIALACTTYAGAPAMSGRGNDKSRSMKQEADLGLRYYKAGLYDQAFPHLKKAADGGNALCMAKLGVMYGHGTGLRKDDAQAIAWYRKSAEAGEPLAMNNLANMYVRGEGGLPKDEVQAAFWYRKAVRAGYPLAMANLGEMFDRQGDAAKAVTLFRQSAAAGNAIGMRDLASSYAHGLGVPKDEVQAVYWYKKATLGGDSIAVSSLGLMYIQGQGGLQRDDAKAVACFQLAASAGNPVAMKNLSFMYANGRGGLPKDESQSAYWYRQAIRLSPELRNR